MLTLPLTQGETPPLSLVGGKALNLMRLTLAGIPVPPGFCVTTRAYQAFAVHNSIDSLGQDLLCEDENATRLAASQDLRRAVLTGIIPEDVVESVRECYRALSNGDERCPVAVRSSATSEDLQGASFAGAHATLLNISGLPAVLDAIRICWASLWKEQAASYRSRVGTDARDSGIAVIVQRMVDSKVSGVLFTVDPVTRDRNRIVIDACWGLGEALVSGTTLPDHYELDLRSFRVCAEMYGKQREIVQCAEEGTQTVAIPEFLRQRPCLTRQQLDHLAVMGLFIQTRFGPPQDIEWAIGPKSDMSSTGTFYILQSRPITTLAEPAASGNSDPWENPVPGAMWVRRSGGVVEHLAGPVSPLFATAQLSRICAHLDAECPEMGVVTPAPTYALINGYFFNRSDYRLSLKALLLPLNYWKAARKGARYWREHVLPDQQAALSALTEFDINGASATELVGHIERLLSFNALAWDNAIRASRTYVFTEPLFRRFFERFIEPVAGGDALTFLCGFETQVMIGEHVLWDLAESARLLPAIGEQLRNFTAQKAWERISDDPVCRAWGRQLTDYCRKFGHVGASLDYLDSGVAGDPVRALRSVRLRMKTRSDDPVERQHKLALERKIATARVLRELRKRPMRRRVFQWLLAWAQEGASTREDIFFYALQGWPLARDAILRLGKALVEARALTVPEDIFFLTWEEVCDAVVESMRKDWPALAGERRAAYERQNLLTPPAGIPLDGPPLTARRKLTRWLKQRITGSTARRDAGILWGAPVSPGVVTGPAHIAASAEEAEKLCAGEILVTSAATPEWIPAFAIAAGLVTDVGGPLSHSSIIAREFGIPTVMGVGVATTTISEGQLITVDGAAGSVRLHEANQ